MDIKMSSCKDFILLRQWGSQVDVIIGVKENSKGMNSYGVKGCNDKCSQNWVFPQVESAGTRPDRQWMSVNLQKAIERFKDYEGLE